MAPLDQLTSTMTMDASPLSKRARMDRYSVGDRVDCTDLEGLWHEATVKEVDSFRGYRVHFLGWSNRWDEWVELSSQRIQPPYTKVRNWRPLLSVGDPVEVRSATYPDRWLSGVVVDVDADSGRVKCEYTHDSHGGCRWLDVAGEEICLPNTHFSRQLDNTVPLRVEPAQENEEIHSEARAGNTAQVVKILHHNPKAVHSRGPMERTPLLMASEACRVECLRALIAAGARVTDVDRSNANCLHLAVRGPKERCANVVRELADRGVDVNGRDSRLSTPLHLVSMRGYPLETHILLSRGAHVNARDMSGVTPLRHAAYRGEEAIVSMLLHYGADPTIPDASGGKPMDVACYLRNKPRKEVVMELLKEGHRGYMLKKTRQVAAWSTRYTGLACKNEILSMRRQQRRPPPVLEWTQASCQRGGACVSAVARYVTHELNGDLFTELMGLFL